ncbi:MAG: hypothetical protein HOE90_08590 [Bacteriovoracaceae bacterium]|jgi:hypothetical protein|nr:hypothetical protein [Bacteriovoracaceae bacterium]
MSEYQEIAEEISRRLEEKKREGGIRVDEIPEIIGNIIDRNINCYPGKPCDKCCDKAFFLSLSSKSNAKGRGHLDFKHALDKIVQHMQGICFQETHVAVCFTDSLEPNAFGEWKANLKQIKNNASVQIYLLSGGKATEIPI